MPRLGSVILLAKAWCSGSVWEEWKVYWQANQLGDDQRTGWRVILRNSSTLSEFNLSIAHHKDQALVFHVYRQDKVLIIKKFAVLVHKLVFTRNRAKSSAVFSSNYELVRGSVGWGTDIFSVILSDQKGDRDASRWPSCRVVWLGQFGHPPEWSPVY